MSLAHPSSLGPRDLVLCSGSFGWDAPLADRIRAASRAGFRGLSVWARDYERARAAGLSDADLRSLLDDHGVEVAELDGVWAWLPGADRSVPASEDPVGFFRHREDALYRVADAIGGRSLNAIDAFGGDWGVDAAAEAFASLCDRAARHGLLVHLEFMPWSRIPDVGSAWEIARRAERPNAGIVVDSWHFFRGNPDWKALARIPGDRVGAVQLADAPSRPDPDWLAETLHGRLLPGEGELDLPRLVAALREIGAVAPLGAEVFSDALHALPPEDVARRAGDSMRNLVAQADARNA
jgi:sugar phosphate isomerase/epimerase